MKSRSSRRCLRFGFAHPHIPSSKVQSPEVGGEALVGNAVERIEVMINISDNILQYLVQLVGQFCDVNKKS